MIGGVTDDQFISFVRKRYVDQESRLSVKGFQVSNHVFSY